MNKNPGALFGSARLGSPLHAGWMQPGNGKKKKKKNKTRIKNRNPVNAYPLASSFLLDREREAWALLVLFRGC